MGKLMNGKTDEVILEDIRTADNFFERFRGLMGIPSLPKNVGLMIKPCNSVHCFFMKFPIDVVFLDNENRVVHIMEGMKPGSISPIVWKAKYVVEANIHVLSKKLQIGDELFLKE